MSSKPALTCIPKRAENTVFRTNLDGTVVIMRLDDEQYFYSLDRIAAEAWLLMDGRKSLQAIGRILVRRHKPPAKRLESDLQSLVNRLVKNGLIRLGK